MSNLLEQVNGAQLAAITHREGPLLIVAGAGTGKTTVITQRIAWLIEQGLAKPEHILALTFTDKAAGEMEERVDLLLPFGYVDLQISTFHAFCERLLREHGVEIGLSCDFKVFSELDAWLLARQHFDRFTLDYYRPLGNPTKHLRSLLTHFSRCKDAAIMPEAYAGYVSSHFPQGGIRSKDSNGVLRSVQEGMATEMEEERKRLTELAQAYATYQKILQENDACDFGDLLMYVLELLRRRPRVLAFVREKYRFVLVDEFQDTNFAQYELIKLVSGPRDNLTVVGDDDQAIYKFRGASLANILQFQADFPGAKKVVLTHNYRSVQPILDQAHRFIQANNPHRLEAQDEVLSKRLLSQREGQGIIEHIHCSTQEEEAEAIAAKILAIKKEHTDVDWSDFGILVRSNDTANAYLGPLERAQIPFQFLALSGLYGKPCLLDLLAYVRVIDNPFDSPSMYRLLTMPIHEVPAQAIAELSHLANRKGKALGEACEMGRAEGAVQGSVADRVEGLLAFLARMRTEAARRRIKELFLVVAKESGYLEWLNGRPEREKRDAFGFLQQFYQRMKRFEERHDHPVLHHFLEEFNHERDAGEDGALAADIEAGPDVVKIMTVHGSKGLEFRFVFVVSLVDRRFPAQARAEAIPLPEGLSKEVHPEGDGHLEEERRLFYVAITRAKEHLYFTSAEDYGGTRKRKLSRFLVELGYTAPDSSSRGVIDEAILSQVGGRIASPSARNNERGEIVIEVPKQFSFTQLIAFGTCPLQYKFAHIFKIPIFGKWSMSFGKTMHNTLQRFFETWIERTTARQAGMPVSLEELETLYCDNWIDEWYADDKAREEYRMRGLESLRTYYAQMKESPPHVAFIEQPFTLKIGSLVLKGRIDRIDRFEDGVEIIDYKTGAPKTAEEIKKDAGKREQLYVYQLAAKNVLGLNVKKLTFHYLEDNSRVSFLGTSEELLKLEERIVERVNKIKLGIYDPTPGYHCRYCDFADICEFRAKS